MNKRTAIIIIALLVVATTALGILFYVDHTDQANQISSLNADVADKAATIDTLNADVADKAATIDTLNADVADKAATIDTLNADVADKAATIDTLNADVADKAATIDTLNADVADKVSQITSLNADVTDRDTRITGLTASVTDLTAQITSLNTDVTDRDARITGLLASVTDLDEQVTLLANDVYNKANTISSLNVQLAQQKTKLIVAAAEAQTASDAITSLTAEKATLEAHVADQKAKLDAAATAAATAADQIASLTADKTNLEVQVASLRQGPDFANMTDAELTAYIDKVTPHLTKLGYIVSLERPVWTCVSCGKSNQTLNCSTCGVSREESALLDQIDPSAVIYIWHKKIGKELYRIEGSTAYLDDYNSKDIGVYAGLYLRNQSDQDIAVNVRASIDGRDTTWKPDTVKANNTRGFVMDSRALSKGDHTIKWYVNDVCVLTEVYHARNGHSALYNQLMDDVRTSHSVGIYNKNTNKLVMDNIKAPALDQLEANEIFSPRLKITNNSSKALANFDMRYVSNGQIVYYDDRTINTNASHLFWSSSATYEIGTNEYVWYINGIELTRTSFTLTETSK